MSLNKNIIIERILDIIDEQPEGFVLDKQTSPIIKQIYTKTYPKIDPTILSLCIHEIITKQDDFLSSNIIHSQLSLYSTREDVIIKLLKIIVQQDPNFELNDETESDIRMVFTKKCNTKSNYIYAPILKDCLKSIMYSYYVIQDTFPRKYSCPMSIYKHMLYTLENENSNQFIIDELLRLYPYHNKEKTLHIYMSKHPLSNITKVKTCLDVIISSLTQQYSSVDSLCTLIKHSVRNISEQPISHEDLIKSLKIDYNNSNIPLSNEVLKTIQNSDISNTIAKDILSRVNTTTSRNNVTKDVKNKLIAFIQAL